jgi:DNA polymerase (family 10)
MIGLLEEIATLLELKGENPFKCRAYSNVARMLGSVAEDELRKLCAEKRLREIKGVGPGIVKDLEELIGEGKVTLHQELLAATPPGLLDMLKVPSLGPKKVKTIFDELGIATVGELEYACNENRLANLKGFGPKSQEKVLAGIAHLKTSAGRFLYAAGRKAADQLLAKLAGLPAVAKVEVAGSLRRRKEIIQDIDLVCATADAEAVMEAFTSSPGVKEIIGRGPTKSSVRLDSGLQVDLRAVTAEEYPFALLYFTGSKEHNTAMRGRAKRMEFKLNEYGLFRADETRVACASEEEIFKALGLAYIPPEIREDAGEFEAAEAGALPGLVEPEHLKGVFHCHTTYSDGSASVKEMALAARKLGYAYMGLSDHSQTAAYAGGLKVDRLLAQWAEIDQVNAELGDFRILKGIESDILPDGRLDYDDSVLAQFDFVIGSVHSSFQLDRAAQTQRILRAMENPYLTMVGHLTGRILLARAGIEVDVEAILEGAAKHHVVIELNANPQRLDMDWRHLKSAQDRGLLISINPDAHSTDALKNMALNAGIARKGWIRPGTVLNAKPLPEVLAFFAEQRKRKGAAP